MYHSGLSYLKVGLALNHSHEAVHQWYHQIAELFDPESDRHGVIAVDETKVATEDEEIYVWAAVNVDMFETVHVEVSLDRSDLDALVFLKTVLARFHGEPVVLADRGPWYDWPLNDFDLPCRSRRETWGERSLVEAWFFVFKYRTMLFLARLPYPSSWQSADRWAKAFATFHNALR